MTWEMLFLEICRKRWNSSARPPQYSHGGTRKGRAVGTLSLPWGAGRSLRPGVAGRRDRAWRLWSECLSTDAGLSVGFAEWLPHSRAWLSLQGQEEPEFLKSLGKAGRESDGNSEALRMELGVASCNDVPGQARLRKTSQ